MEHERPIHPFSRAECHLMRHLLDAHYFDIIDHMADPAYSNSYVDTLVVADQIRELYKLLWVGLDERREVIEQSEQMRQITENSIIGWEASGWEGSSE